MLNVSNLCLSKSEKQILSNINLSIKQGESVCFLGKNGAGKTTLLKSIVGIYKLDDGNSFFEGIDLATNYRNQVIQEIGVMVFNDAYYDFLTGRDNIEIVRNFYNNPYFSTDELINLFELTSVENQLVNKYSAGYKQRLLLALSVVNCPKLVIWDEPFNSIDANYIKSISDIIKYFKKSWNTTFLITNHSSVGIDGVFSRMIVLKDSSICLDFSITDLDNFYFYRFIEYIPIGKICFGVLHFKVGDDNRLNIISSLDINDFCNQNNLNINEIICSSLSIKDIYDFI